MQNAQQKLAKRAQSVSTKIATSPEQWELAGEILDQGTGHPVFRKLAKQWDEIVQALGEAKKRSQKMRQMGVGRTEDPTFIVSMVIPAMEDYQKDLEAVIRQIKQKVEG